MSRIAGILAPSDPTFAKATLSAIAPALRASPGWKEHPCTDGPATMIAMGWRAPVAAKRDAAIAVVDGVFYNREELDKAENDAARLIAAYRAHGFEGALKRINGEFAAALYDRNKATLWLGRDRLGIKPLYYVVRPEFFAFASQPRALLHIPGISSVPNHRYVALFAAAHYRVFDNAPTESPYKDILQLPAGSLLEVKAGTVRQRRWWDLQDLPNFDEPEQVLAERYRDLLTGAVGRRVAVHDRPAFTLSGGLDSSSVLSSAVATSGQQQDAFSSVYADETYDERSDIQPMLVDKVRQWHPVEIPDDIDVFSTVREMITAHDEPVATATWLSHFVLAKQVAADGYTSLFGGLGGDELNAGEYEYFVFHFADLARSGQNELLAHEIDCWARYHDHPIWRKTADIARAAMSRYTDAAYPGVVQPDTDRLFRYRDALNPDYHDLSGFEPAMDHPFNSWLKNRTYQDLFRETAPCCLRAEDRQCTAAGLDHTDPFLDYRLVEFMFRIPGEMKIRDGITKRLLREAMRGILPEETRSRIKKTGWNAPAHLWFTGRGLEELRDMVASRTFIERGVYNAVFVERIIDEHVEIVTSGAVRENHMMFLWQLVNLETWLAAQTVAEYSGNQATHLARSTGGINGQRV